MLESILLTSTRIDTFIGLSPLTNASGFFFERGARLFLVTSRHVLINEPTGHFPDRIAIELHIDPENMAKSTGFSIPLYRDGAPLWRQGLDRAGAPDVAAIEIDRRALPKTASFRAFAPENIEPPGGGVEVGAQVLVVGFPLGFHDTLHHLPVARGAVIASSFGLRFGGQGYFLTDARTHRGASGARSAFVAARCQRTQCRSRRGARTELRLVRRHIDDADEPCLKLNIRSFRDSPRRRASP